MEKLIIEIKQKLGIIEVYKSHNFRVFYEGNKSPLKCHMISNITKVIDFFSLKKNPFEIKSIVLSQISKNNFHFIS